MDHRTVEKIITATILVAELIQNAIGNPEPKKPPRKNH